MAGYCRADRQIYTTADPTEQMLPWLLQGKRLTSEIKRALHSKMQEHPQTPGGAASSRQDDVPAASETSKLHKASICPGRERKRCPEYRKHVHTTFKIPTCTIPVKGPKSSVPCFFLKEADLCFSSKLQMAL